MAHALVYPELPERQLNWSLERYYRAIELGLLTKEDQVELLFGKLVKKMAIGQLHSACVKKMSKYFYRKYLDRYELIQENPISLIYDSAPEPDFVIADLKENDYKDGHPTPADIHLVVEVADTTVATDRQVKSAIYAASGIEEYWIVNLVSRQVEVHLQPQEDGTYGSVTHYGEGTGFESPFVGRVEVWDLLP